MNISEGSLGNYNLFTCITPVTYCKKVIGWPSSLPWTSRHFLSSIFPHHFLVPSPSSFSFSLPLFLFTIPAISPPFAAFHDHRNIWSWNIPDFPVCLLMYLRHSKHACTIFGVQIWSKVIIIFQVKYIRIRIYILIKLLTEFRNIILINGKWREGNDKLSVYSWGKRGRGNTVISHSRRNLLRNICIRNRK